MTSSVPEHYGYPLPLHNGNRIRLSQKQQDVHGGHGDLQRREGDGQLDEAYE